MKPLLINPIKTPIVRPVLNPALADYFWKIYGVSSKNLVFHGDMTRGRGGSVSAFQNLALNGAGHNLVQGTGANQPSITKVNGRVCLSFNGTTDFMAQPEQDDETGASFGPTVHGLSMAAGQSFFAPSGVDISPFAGVAGSSTPYIVVIHDSAGKVAWGYLAEAGAGETLGSELLSNPTFNVNTTGWTAYLSTLASVVGGQSGNCLQVTRTDGTQQAGYQLITGSTAAGKLYKATGYVKSGSSGNEAGSLFLDNNVAGSPIRINFTSSGSWVQYTIRSTRPASVSQYQFAFEKQTGTVGTMLFDEASVKEVTDCAATGCRVVTTRNGAISGWAYEQSGFNRNDLSYIEVYKSDFQRTGAFTECWWVYCVDPTNFVIVNKLDATNNKGFRVGVNASDRPYCSISDGTDTQTATWGSALSANTWYFIEAGYDGTNAFVAVNAGIRVTQAQSAPADTHFQYKIGTDGTNYANGSFAFGVSFSKLLSAAKCQRIYNASKERYGH